jgi:purine nucleosidase
MPRSQISDVPFPISVYTPRHHLLIDPDPGVDDALALMLAHSHANARVVALTITAGNVGLSHTTANALKLLDVIGADTPVFAGAAQPFVRAADDAAFVHGLDGFGDTGYSRSSRALEAEHAALAMLRLSRERPGELTFVMLGPLTNLALALTLDPELPKRVKRLVIMGGAVTGRGNVAQITTEFNIGFDPEAAHIVFSRWPDFELVDWEQTVAHGLDFDAVEHWLATDHASARFYAAISRKTRDWTRARGRPRFLAADALAMAVVLEPEHVARWHARQIGIELDGALTRGMTVVDWDQRGRRAPNARIMDGFDPKRFAALLAGALGVHD